VKIAGFIPTELSGNLPITPIDPASKGDNRSFDASASCLKSKVCVILNYSQGTGVVYVSGSCRDDGVCKPALPFGRGNSISIDVDPSRQRIHVQAGNSAHRLVNDPEIRLEAQVDLSRSYFAKVNGPGRSDELISARGPTLSIHGTTYPAMEAYQLRGGRVSALYQDNAGLTVFGVPVGLADLRIARRNADLPLAPAAPLISGSMDAA
jgi:hypothetical protein